MIKLWNANTFTDGDEMINLNNTRFMPYLHLKQYNNKLPTTQFEITDIDSTGRTVFNSTKLRNYVDLVISIQVREFNQTDKYIYFGFRNCREEDFTDKKFQVDKDLAKIIPSYFCPNFTEQDLEWYRIKESYINETFRQSMSVEIHECRKDLNPNCKERDDVQQFLHTFMFTFYTLQGQVVFKNNLM